MLRNFRVARWFLRVGRRVKCNVRKMVMVRGAGARNWEYMAWMNTNGQAVIEAWLDAGTISK